MKITYDTKHLKQVVINRGIVLGQELKKIDESIEYGCLVLENDDAIAIKDKIPFCVIDTLEDTTKQNIDYDKELERIIKKYDFINFSKAIASERSFIDYSFLLGTTGHRKEDKNYMIKIVVDIALTIERHFQNFKPDAVVSGAPDAIWTYMILVMAEFYGIKLILLRPGWLNDFDSFECGYIGNDLYTISKEMKYYYDLLQKTSLTKEEIERVEKFKDYVKNFQYKKLMQSRHKRDVTKIAITPNRNIFAYYNKIKNFDKSIVFTKPDLKEKLKANILRYFRKKQLDKYLQNLDNNIPEKSIFFPLHFQPEESTLVKGINYANQIALIEHISKSIPLGYTLIVKEHPLGRGNRPLWQYKHIESFYNVKMVELPSNGIIQKVDLIISISGTIGIESLVNDKPIIMLGKTYYMFDESLFHYLDNINRLDELIYKIVVKKETNITKEKVDRFLLAYLKSLKPQAPFNTIDGFKKYAKYIVENIKKF